MACVKVCVPATAANLGSGFDCFGLALGLYQTLKMEEIPGRVIRISARGEGNSVLAKNKTSLSLKAAYKVFEASGYNPKGLRISIVNNIPVARGLGSSAASIVAGALAANEICKRRLPQENLMQICSDIETHADNVVASFLGGLTICGHEKKKLIYRNFFVRYGLRAVIAVPLNLEIKTKEAVRILPKKVPFRDAAFNISRSAFFISGMLTDDLEAVGLGMSDRLHHPYREKMIPGLEDVFRAAKKAGAQGVSLSGSGPAVMTLTHRYPKPIGDAMKAAFKNIGIKAKVMVLDIDNKGARIIK